MTDFMVCSELGLKRYKAGETVRKANFASAKKVTFRIFLKISFFYQFFNEILNKIATKHQIRIKINLQ